MKQLMYWRIWAFIGFQIICQSNFAAAEKLLIAQDDRALTQAGSPIEIPVLLNDIGPTNSTISLKPIVTQPSHGTIRILNDQLHYQPDNDFTGIDHFSYKIGLKFPNKLTATGTVSVAVNAPFDIKEAREQILGGVTSIHSGQNPGQIGCFGETAGIISYYPDGSVDGSMIIAATLGKGRIIALPDHQMLNMHTYATTGDTLQFFENSLNWLTQNSNKTVRILTKRGELATWLKNSGYSQVTHTKKLDLETLKSTDVIVGWLGSNLTHEEVAVLRESVLNGTALFICDSGYGYSWWWNKKEYEIPLNQLLKDAGVLFGGRASKYSETVSITKPTIKRFLWSDLIEEIKKTGKSTNNETENICGEILSLVGSSLPPNDLRTLEFQAYIMQRIQQLTPSFEHPTEDPIEKAILTFEANTLQQLPVEKITKHRMADIWYGAINEPADRSKKNIVLNTEIPQWRPLGMYAPAGEIVTIEFPEEFVGKGYKIRVNAHVDNISQRKKWIRIPKVHRSFDINTSSLQVGAAVGGSLFVDFGKNAPNLGDIQITVTGAVEQPHFIFGKHSNNDWNKTIKRKPAPYVIVETPRIILHEPMDAPCSTAGEVKDMEALATFWDNAVRLEDELYLKQNKSRTYAEILNRDVQISAGYAHAGYPYQASWNWMNSFDLQLLREKGSWGNFHEMGHNHQESWWTMSQDIEVTVNLFSNYVMEHLSPGYAFDWGRMSNPLHVWGQSKKFLQEKPIYDDLNAMDKLYFYLLIADHFGWDTYKNVFKSYKEQNQKTPHKMPKTDEEKLDQLFIHLSRETGYNLCDYFSAWNRTPSDEALEQVSQLPSWDPLQLYFCADNWEIKKGKKTRIYFFVADENSKLKLQINGKQVILKKKSSTSYLYNLTPQRTGEIELIVTLYDDATERKLLYCN